MIGFFIGKINKSPLITQVYREKCVCPREIVHTAVDKLKPETRLDDAVDRQDKAGIFAHSPSPDPQRPEKRKR